MCTHIEVDSVLLVFDAMIVVSYSNKFTSSFWVPSCPRDCRFVVELKQPSHIISNGISAAALHVDALTKHLLVLLDGAFIWMLVQPLLNSLSLQIYECAQWRGACLGCREEAGSAASP